MSGLQLICIPKGDVAKLWHGPVHDMLDAAFAAADLPMPEDLLQELETGTRLLWVVVTDEATIVAAMMTQLFEMRSGRVCKMMECGGSRLDEWKHMRAAIEQYAKREGCDRVMVIGRPGWAAILDDYRTTAVVLEKRI